jgi:class 3 adenylate cyclase
MPYAKLKGVPVPHLSFPYTQVSGDESRYGPDVRFNALAEDAFATFNPSVLGLGDVACKGHYVHSMASFFDLEGFTDFCNQVESHLVIPEFLSRYLQWLFQQLAAEFKEGSDGTTVRLWGSLPFYAKFLGDGILFMWDTDLCQGFSGKVNIAQSLLSITDLYRTSFLPEIRKAVSKPPCRLRCGIALGQVISIGGGADYVGSCINLASRLQKLSTLSFAISRRGFDLSKSPDLQGSLRSFLVLKRTAIRSIGEQELVYIRRDEFDAMSSDEQQLFQDP